MRRILALIAVLALTLAACGGGDSGGNGGSPDPTDPPGMTGDAAAGSEIFSTTCVACHGEDATGISGLGADLTSNEFVSGQSESELVEFLEVGRPADHPDSQTGIQMPPKGGDPSLSDQDLYDLAAFMQGLPGN